MEQVSANKAFGGTPYILPERQACADLASFLSRPTLRRAVRA